MKSEKRKVTKRHRQHDPAIIQREFSTQLNRSRRQEPELSLTMQPKSTSATALWSTKVSSSSPPMQHSHSQHSRKAFSNSELVSDLPDLSHLSEQERKIIEAVLERQKAEEEKDLKLTRLATKQPSYQKSNFCLKSSTKVEQHPIFFSKKFKAPWAEKKFFKKESRENSSSKIEKESFVIHNQIESDESSLQIRLILRFSLSWFIFALIFESFDNLKMSKMVGCFNF
ncbi:hypothetical protein BpHYR1_000123 [Brachionus plicatilis]|uniref:Uncharacterized protein n=1 Tax=Brachionus plicatilis TaxID=10195 RepID=A0A3M7S8H5_BRAPC|nr:hypothetical protein BpHYR1_000123 [Brachionus plicatilis]